MYGVGVYQSALLAVLANHAVKFGLVRFPPKEAKARFASARDVAGAPSLGPGLGRSRRHTAALPLVQATKLRWRLVLTFSASTGTLPLAVSHSPATAAWTLGTRTAGPYQLT